MNELADCLHHSDISSSQSMSCILEHAKLQNRPGCGLGSHQKQECSITALKKEQAELLLFLSLQDVKCCIKPDAAVKLRGANVSADCLLERLSPKGDQQTHENDSIDSAVNISVLEESPGCEEPISVKTSASSFKPR